VSRWQGGPVSARASCVVAPNPGPMTLDGTNTWLLREPHARRCVVVDPGPMHEPHLRVVLDIAGEVAVVLLTHGHQDHAEGAGRFAELAGCPVRALDPAYTQGGQPLGEGDLVSVDGLEVRVLATPGHTADSACFHLPAEHTVLTGDTVLGRGTTVVAYPGGELGPYLASLQRLRHLAEAAELATVLPGHGPVLNDPFAVIDGYLTHRQERLEQVAAAVAAGAGSPREVVERVYVDVSPALWPAAELSVRAALAYLNEPGANEPGANERGANERGA
jgi:glyoxylase-like metal-dependent hydrolase (beta-lactamase superfamily II)